MTRYGIDAPGVIRAFAIVAVALALGGFAASAAGVPWLPTVLRVLALPPLALAGIMLTYSSYGKFRVRDTMLDGIAWRGDEAVLDVGTGRGLLAIGAAHRLRAGHVTGIDLFVPKDLSGNTLAAAEANVLRDGVADRVTILAADAQSLPFADASFDVALSLLCLHNVADPARACAEIARVLKPGGVALLADYVPTQPYARALAQAGFAVGRNTRRFGTALGPLWLVRADKPGIDG